MQNRNPWIPVTPEKPGLSGDSHAEVLGNHMETTNWHELLGIYSGLVQDDAICNSHQSVSPFPIVDLNHKEHVHDRFFGFNQGPANLHSDSLVWNANPLSELSGTKNALYAPPANGAPMERTLPVDRHMSLQPDSRAESNCTTGNKVAGLMLQQNHVLHSSQDISSYNLQHLPNASYWPSYNLNLPPGSEAGESSTTHGSFRLAPVTPDKQKHSKSSQLAEVPPLFIDKFSIAGKDKQENIHVSLPPEDASAKVTALPPLLMDKSLEKDKMKKNVKISLPCEDVNDNHDEFLKNGDMSPVVITTSLQEKNIPEDGNYREIDLNKTPHQKPPKRRKHRPKVIVERKPKRIPRPAPTNNNTPEGNPSGKRTYKLKKDIKTSSSTQPTDAKNEVKAVNPSSAAKSCRRVLNFEVETGVEKESKDMDGGDKAETNNENKLPANANSNSQDVEQYMGLHAASKTYEVKEGRLKEYSSEKHEILPQVSLSLASVVPSTTGKDHTLNVIARILNLRNAQTNESGSQNRYKQVNQCISGGLAKLVSRANATKVNLDPRRQWMLQSRSQHLEDLHDITQEQGLKGEYSATQLTNPGTVKMGSQLSCHRGLTPGLQSSDSFKLWQNVETSKRKKVKGKFEGTSYSVPSTTNTVKHCSKQVDGRGNKQTKNAVNHVTAGSRNLEDPSQRDPISSEGNQSIASPVPLSLRKQTAAPALSSQAFSMDEVFNQQAKHQYSSKEPAGSEEKPRYIISVDEITNRLENLHIACNSMEIVGEEQNALVPYQGDGAIVPHMEFSHLRKHKPRPKVDLDPETNRLWNLLMGKKGSESTETMDEDREKRWEGERNVFRGRIDSFIARMHLVQGDRRFSKWKGSVVDSVIGVFLTQNVSDHLSSSAYMSLAAKFPLQTTTIRPTCCQNDGSQFVGHQIQIDHPGQNKCYDQRMMSGPTCNFSFLTSRKSSEHGEEKDKTITTRISAHLQDRREEENVMASQSSVGSFFSEVIDSEFKDEIFGCNFRREYSHNSFQQTQIIAGFQDYQYPLIGSSFLDKRPMLDNQQLENHLTNGQNLNLDNGSLPNAYPITASTLHNQTLVSLSSNYQFSTTAGLEEWEARFLGLPGKEIPATGAGHAQDSIAPIAESSLLSQQTGMPKIRESRMDNTVPNMHQEQQISVPARFHTMNGRDSINFNQEQRGETVQPGSTFMKEPKTCADALNKKTSGNGHQVSSTEPSNEIGPKTSNVRKRKVEKEKTEAFNWDSLRKQVDSKIGQKERSKETMDSLDYEALRNADVREISETIKERGMNNMLAERIKDFLDRLVREQGRIDLEWLRYVPPDKSKDYLLSIRGLGLKSVECVRLLTLHHLAFPVDTNVGRIAVRLGWVPLQPLPESLQLHLLELYPVLESIQKYLWPRLCNLDQKTLYELHYQMITFGKVFCTKREPNCNACPMRGECRHFASAFASARLALPGPEEGRLVSSPAPAIADKNSGIKLKLMPLPPLEDNFNRGAWLSMGYCEPIIEEPTTPEQFTEVSEADIEDAFCEDPDEIPTIKLNIEKFTENLQSFMQEHNMEMENADISKALVALSPELASIPVPKLKNVNRLRTEHQVYELPDSHPLLIGLDRREFDDPSPYLLAIWTPGETADSVEPPESKCNSHGLCDKETCMSCNSSREAQSQTVRGTLLIPCRTAMRGSFPLNGTYFQVNEVFADHESSLVPINVPRNLLWNLPRRTVFFGTSVSTIFKGLSAEGIQSCFWKGFVCVRGFDRKTRAPRPLMARLHFPASKLTKKSEQQIKGSSSAERNQNRKDGGPRQRH